MKTFNYKAYITLYHDFPADFRDCIFFPSVAGEKTFEAAIAPYGDPFENKTSAFTSEEETRITYNEYVNPAQTLLTVSIDDPKGRAFPGYPEGISRRIDNLRRVTLIRVEINGIYGEIARSDVFFFNVTAANVIYNGEEAPTSMQSAALAYVVEPNIWASALARDTVFYTGAADSAGLNALAVKGGTMLAATPAVLNTVERVSPHVNPLAGAVTGRVKPLGVMGNVIKKACFSDDSTIETPWFLVVATCTVTSKGGPLYAHRAVFCAVDGNPQNAASYISGFAQADGAERKDSAGTVKETYSVSVDGVFVIPFSFFNLKNGANLPSDWFVVDGESWTFYKGTRSTSVIFEAKQMFTSFSGFIPLTPASIKLFERKSNVQKSIIDTYGSAVALMRVLSVGTQYNRITAPQTFYPDTENAFGVRTELFIDPYAADIKIYLYAFGEKLEITNDFECPLIIGTDTQAIAQQKIARTVSVIQGAGNTAISGATIAAGIATGNPLAVIGGAVSLTGQIGNIAQRATEQIKPKASTTGSGAGSLNALYYGGLYFEAYTPQNSASITEDITARGYETEIHVEETTGGAGFALFNDQAAPDFLEVKNATISAGVLSPEAAEFVKTRLENGVKIIKTFEELKKDIGV